MKRNDGSAYLEVIISVALITTFLIPAYSKFLNIDQVIVTSDQMVIASNIANQTIENYRSSETALVVGETSETTTLLPDGQIKNILTQEDTTNPSLIKVVTTISWQGIGSNKQYQLATEINQ